jgi:hypothetical protein
MTTSVTEFSEVCGDIIWDEEVGINAIRTVVALALEPG